MPNQVLLDKMKEMLVLADSSMSKEEFLANFKVVIDLVKKMKADNQAELERLNRALDSLPDKAQSMINSAEQDVMAQVRADMAVLKAQHEEMMAMCEKKMSEMKDGEDGEDSDADEIAELVIEKMTQPVVDQVGKNIPQLGEGIRDALELLQGDERLSIDAIKGLKEELQKSGKRDSSAIVGGGGVARNAVRYYDLSDQLNGVLKTFSLPVFNRVLSVQLSSVPVLRATTDFTSDVSASTITFTSEIDAGTELSSGMSLIVLYSE